MLFLTKVPIMLKNLLAVAFSCFVMGAANAATVTSENPTLAELAVLSATSLDLPDGAQWLTPAPAIVQGSSDGAYRSPYEALGNFGTIEYWNVSGVENYLTFDGLRTSLSFLWGSPDAYNFVTLINTINGGPNLVVALGNLISPDIPAVGGGASFVTIGSFAFNKVLFSSPQPAFEIGNITAAVPLPAGGVLLLIGLGGLAMLRRRSASAQI